MGKPYAKEDYNVTVINYSNLINCNVVTLHFITSQISCMWPLTGTLT